MPTADSREIRLVVQVRGEVAGQKGWRTAYTSDTITQQSATAEIIAALDGAVTKLETMTGRL